ncbi:(4Fe-4S)-binding protein [Serratia ureilytica]
MIRLTFILTLQFAAILPTACVATRLFLPEPPPVDYADNAEPAEVKRVIDTCPSGALKYREK